ncbi:Dabb family protein [Hominisplanchenecus murintestinalis]|jgi:hypothetical protein|uniref:Dabb family protein n=1 Tax=Hominisplanchenecus murintestinalis TaxID=2941517 RepID=A0AC61QVI2_9FIRM|nr:Dabb family protein [Hominisplanchenecus murintestinalis]NBH99598.1 Dabb family protein [Lachnospiraceae bacterium]NBI76908.1 Dabb family protein [Lachnospiraceae bacterium]RKJ76078.1 Dabb family protein [Anaerotruncus sp. 1XD22-93]TGX96488.1 Dabb family protein [Hominisplanchenecus murintestinalis]
MVRHIVTWCFKEEVEEAKKPELKAAMAEHLEALAGKVPGLVSARFVADLLPSSTHDMVLLTEHNTPEDLKAYATHPEHVKVADTYVRPFVCNRTAIDFEE